MFEAWSVAVKVSLIDGVTTGLLGMTRHFRSANVEASLLQKRLEGIRRTALIGGGMTVAGFGILAALKPALEQAKLFQNEATKFSMYGMGDKVNAEAVKYAKAMGVIGTSSTDALRLVTEAQGVFRESGALNVQQQLVGAKIAAPILAKLAFIETSLSDEKRTAAHAQDLAMLRFIESRGGANDPQKFAAIADWGFKLSKSSGGIVDWSQLQQFAATAGAGGFNLTQDAIAKLEPVMADLKGGRTGSGLRVAFQRLLGTQRGLPKQAVQEYLSLGLWDHAKVELNKQGGIAKFLGRPGEVLMGRDQLATDPVGFFVDKFLPAISKKYGPEILGDSVKARTERAVEESLVFGPGTASAVFSQVDKLLPAISRSTLAQNKELGIDKSADLVSKTLSGKQVDLQAKYKTLMEQMGESVLPLAIAGMSALIPIFRFLSNQAINHPRLFDGMIKLVLAVGAALVVGGVATSAVASVQALGLIFSLFRAAPVVAMATEAPAIAAGVEAVGMAVAGFSALPLLGIAAGVVAIGGAIAGVAWLASQKGPATPFKLGHLSMPGLQFPSDHPAARVPHHQPSAMSKVLGNVYMDAKKVGQIVGEHLANMAGSAHQGTASHDPTMSPAPVGFGYPAGF